jgi:hypothetical protein
MNILRLVFDIQPSKISQTRQCVRRRSGFMTHLIDHILYVSPRTLGLALKAISKLISVANEEKTLIIAKQNASNHIRTPRPAPAR